jgi:glycosyltransferase involved in cell wall biosynthesis
MSAEKGGPAEWVRSFSKYITRQGHISDVVTLDHPGTSHHESGSNITGIGSQCNYFYSRQLVPWLQENAHNYDCVIAHGLWRYASYGTWKALRKSNIPYFVYTHGMLDPWFKQNYPAKHLAKWAYWPWTDYRVLRDANAVIFTCEAERRKARESFWLYQCNEIVATIGIEAPIGERAAQIRAFQQAFPATIGKRNILFLGRIHEKKGCDILVTAFANLCKHFDDIHLVFAGPVEEPLKKTLQNIALQHQVNDKISWTGMIIDNVKWGAFHSATLFALPSHQENFGIAVVEALARGIPVLVSNKVDIWEEIHDGNAGLICDDSDDSVTKTLTAFFNLHESVQTNMRENAYRCFQDNFEISQAANNLMAQINKSDKLKLNEQRSITDSAGQ